MGTHQRDPQLEPVAVDFAGSRRQLFKGHSARCHGRSVGLLCGGASVLLQGRDWLQDVI
jgi:hypothetical protein